MFHLIVIRLLTAGVGRFQYKTISVHTTSVQIFLLAILRYLTISISVHDVFGTYEINFGT